MTQLERSGDPFGSDIEITRIPELLQVWRDLDGIEYMERIKAKRVFNSSLTDFLALKGFALGKNEYPQDEVEAGVVGGFYLVGSYFIGEVMDTIPGLDGQPTIVDIKRWENLIKDADGEQYLTALSMMSRISPNLNEVMLQIVKEENDEPTQRALTTGFVDIYFLKMGRQNIAGLGS